MFGNIHGDDCIRQPNTSRASGGTDSGNPNNLLEGRRVHKNEEVEVVLREGLRKQGLGYYCHKTCTLLGNLCQSVKDGAGEL